MMTNGRSEKKEMVILVNYYRYRAENLNERILSEDYYIVLDTETGDLEDHWECWRDMVMRPGAMSGGKKSITYEEMYQKIRANQPENAELFLQLTRENYREWLEEHRDIIYRAYTVDKESE